MNSSIPPVRDRCPHCGAGRSPAAEQCWMCYRAYNEEVIFIADDKVPLSKEKQLERWSNERPLAFLQTNGGTLLVAAVFLLILLGCFQVAPGLAILLFLVGSVALRIAVKPKNTAQRAVFLTIKAIWWTLIIFVAFVIGVCVACFSVCYFFEDMVRP